MTASRDSIRAVRPQTAPPRPSRRYPRARISLPVRIRWPGPLAMRLEVTSTLDASREGFRVRRGQPCAVGTRVWVVFPFDLPPARQSPSEPEVLPAQPEIPARVVRVEPMERERGYTLAFHLEPHRPAAPQAGSERRAAQRLAYGLPILVRPADAPWAEEAMTEDISPLGVRFETAQVFAPGEALIAEIPWSDLGPAAARHGLVLRVDRVRESAPQAADAVLGAWSAVAARWNSR